MVLWVAHKIRRSLGQVLHKLLEVVVSAKFHRIKAQVILGFHQMTQPLDEQLRFANRESIYWKTPYHFCVFQLIHLQKMLQQILH